MPLSRLSLPTVPAGLPAATIVLTAILTSVSGFAQAPRPIPDPIPQAIEKSSLLVEAIDFVRLPRSIDSAPQVRQTNRAFARIQYLLPIPDDSERLIISDLRGLLYLTDEAGSEPQVYLDLREQNVGFDDAMFPNETGLLGFAFHPQFSNQGSAGYGKFYTAYSAGSDSGVADYLDNAADNHESVIREWSASDPRANVFQGTSREVFRIGQFDQNHNIATLAFNTAAPEGSVDYGLLYVALGDGGGAHDPHAYGQSLREPMAGIMRIDPLAAAEGKRYGVPADNPFVSNDSVASEIWAYGLRHPQQISFDIDGRMFITDIGQSQVEEINIGVRGANYGWRLREGTFATAFAYQNVRPGPVYPLPAEPDGFFTYPVAQYDHDEGHAVSSGFVYRGSAIPELQGKYLFTDLVRGRIFFIDTDNLVPGQPALVHELRTRIYGREQNLLEVAGFPNTYSRGNRAGLRMGIDSQGELYLLTKGDGWVRKLVPHNR